MKIRVSELVVGSGEPDKCLEEKNREGFYFVTNVNT